MITENDLREAIAACQGEKNPTSNTCIKLAAYLTILNSMVAGEDRPLQSQGSGYSQAPAPEVFPVSGDSEFERKIAGRNVTDILPEIVSLVEAVQVVNPRLYKTFISRL